MAEQADIRNGRIEPLNTETMFITGYDEWGPVDE